MKLAELQRWKKRGYRVSFERRENGMLHSDYMPDRKEDVLVSEKAAWDLANEIADHAPDNIVNIFVVHGDWVPVEGYRDELLRPYPSVEAA